MALRDMFGPNYKNSDWRIRLKAVENLEDRDVLKQMATSDENESVQTAALQKFTEEEDLAEIIFLCKDPKPEFLIAALEKISREEILAALLGSLNIKHAKTIKGTIVKTLKEIKTQKALANIIKSRSVPDFISNSALELLNDQQLLEDLFLGKAGKNHQQLDRISSRIKDDVFLNKIAADPDQPEYLKAAAAKQIQNQLIDKKGENAVQGASGQKNNIPKKPAITKVEFQITCKECAQPVFVYGPVKETECQYCNAINRIGIQEDWADLMKGAFDGGRVLIITSKQEFTGGRAIPRCVKCNEPLDVDNISNGDDAEVQCKKCKTPFSTFPAPIWFQKLKANNLHPAQIFCGVRETKNKTPKADASHGSAKLILFTCLQCGAALKISGLTPRILNCGFCGTDQYMPDTLWRTLHPIPKKQAWFIRWS